jgi:hypothetical protein
LRSGPPCVSRKTRPSGRLGLPPLRELIRRHGQRAESRPVHRLPELTPRSVALLERPIIQRFTQRGDRLIRLRDAGEGAVAEDGQDPALHELHADLRFRVVSWMVGAGWQHDRAVVRRPIGVRRVQLRLVPAGMMDPCLRIIRYGDFWDALGILDRMRVAADPMGQCLRLLRFYINQAACAYNNAATNSAAG